MKSARLSVLLRSMWFLTLILSLTSAGLAPADDLADYREYVDTVNRVIAAGDGAAAMDLLCEWTQGGRVLEYTKRDLAGALANGERWSAFSHERFTEVFRPPEPVADYFPSNLLTWEDYGFIGSSFGGIRADSVRAEWGGGRLVLSEAPPVAVVDVDLDGTPELTYDGDQPVIHPGLAVAHDDAGDGRREQWLIANPGEDPRQAARIWFYRDGRATSIIIKPDDPIYRCGRSWCFGTGM